MLPIGVRRRQLAVRTLLAGMCLALADGRPAHLTRVHRALTSLPASDQLRLGVIAQWKHGPHRLTCRQAERTFGLAADALAKDDPDGLPSADLAGTCDDLLETSVPEKFKDASDSLAVDWTDMDSFSRPPPARGGPCADPEASWGHRKNNLLRSENELFFGYYFSAAVMMPAENGPPVPELARRATLSSCRHDPVRALVPVLTAMPQAGIGLGDILAGSGYAHRDAAAWALPLRAAGASLVQDLHPHDLFRPQRHPRRCHHRQRQPVLPEDPPPAVGTRAALPRRQPRRHHLARREHRRTGPLQARAHHPRRRRRLPPRRLPRRHGQDPLPAPPRLDDPRPGQARDPHPARASPGLLHTADHHRAARGNSQGGAETRLPLHRAPPVLRPPHRRRTRLRHPPRTPPPTTSAAAGAVSWA